MGFIHSIDATKPIDPPILKFNAVSHRIMFQRMNSSRDYRFPGQSLKSGVSFCARIKQNKRKIKKETIWIFNYSYFFNPMITICPVPDLSHG